MSIDTGRYRQALLAKERELTSEIARLEENARNARSAEVEDPIDEVTSDQAKAAAATELNIAADTLLSVRAALQRLDSGEYGTCIDCGRSIEEKRLQAVPWTPYCLEDQQKHDTEKVVTPFESAL